MRQTTVLGAKLMLHVKIFLFSEQTWFPSSSLLFQEELVKRLKDEGHTADLVYLDFTKAFNFAGLRLLKSFSINGNVFNWIKLDLSGRSAFFLMRLQVYVAYSKRWRFTHYCYCFIYKWPSCHPRWLCLPFCKWSMCSLGLSQIRCSTPFLPLGSG